MSAIHKQWHISTSPLFRIEYQSLVSMIWIANLGCDSLPRFLNPASVLLNEEVNTEEAKRVEEEPCKFSVPTNKSKRYNSAISLTTRICELAKVDADVFRMVMPQLDQMYQNCMLVRNSKSKTTKAAKKVVAHSTSNLPILPESLKRTREDNVNLANKKPKAKRTMKTNSNK